MKPVLSRTGTGVWRCTGVYFSTLGETPADAYCKWAEAEAPNQARRNHGQTSTGRPRPFKVHFLEGRPEAPVLAMTGGFVGRGPTRARALHDLLKQV